MAHVTTSPAPGSMTVPPLFGWEGILSVLVVVVAVAVAFLVFSTTRAGATERSEWQAWLQARSGRLDEPAPDPDDGSRTVRRDGDRPLPSA
jgi:hypothetical protein